MDTNVLLRGPRENKGDEFQFPGTIPRPLQTSSSVCIRVHPWLIFLTFYQRPICVYLRSSAAIYFLLLRLKQRIQLLLIRVVAQVVVQFRARLHVVDTVLLGPFGAQGLVNLQSGGVGGAEGGEGV